MSIWILTIGNSDVQLKAKDNNWQDLYRNIFSNLKLGYTPKPGTKGRYLAPARLMGLTYGQPEAEEFFDDDLVFPLIDNFASKLKDKSIKKIVLVLSDQQAVFKTKASEWRQIDCPYWQDTCELKPVLENYLKSKDCFADATIDEPIILKPSSPNNGLDNWDKTLELVRREFSKKFPHELPEDEIVYVSHQAGTPAISSAVQFVSLAKFGKKVRFLVSNEYSNEALDPIKSSSYLKGIKLQEAEVLLERFDYEGLESLFSTLVDDWNNPENIIVKKIKSLLEVASLWNHAKFEDFAEARGGDARACLDDKSNWWWMAYELAYLSIVRFRQGNMVEAMFHSFRALEGLVINYHAYYAKVENPSRTYGRNAFDSFKSKNNVIWNSHPYIKDLVRSEAPKEDRNDIIDQRNNLFHQLKGFHEEDLYSAWKAEDESNWKNRILSCLNLVSKQSIAPPLEKANLMFKVHDELKNAISEYAELHE